MTTKNPSVFQSAIFVNFKFNVKIIIFKRKQTLMHILYICHAFVP